MSSAMITSLLAFGFGAMCMLLGFFLIVRGIGSSDSESTIKLVGIEIRTSRVGPGVLFALFGLVLTIIAVEKIPADGGAKPATPAGEAGAPAAAPNPAQVAQAPVPAPAPNAPLTATPTTETAQAPQADVSADDAAPSGGGDTHVFEGQKVRAALTRISSGVCPEEYMEPALIYLCNQQLAYMQNTMLRAGPILSVNYVGTEQTLYGPADMFSVQYNGGPAVWKAMLNPDGRFQRLWWGEP